MPHMDCTLPRVATAATVALLAWAGPARGAVSHWVDIDTSNGHINVKLKRFDRERMPWVQVRVGEDEKKHWMLVDTGNNGPIILNPQRFTVTDGTLGSGSGIFEKNMPLLRSELPRVKIGPYVLEDVPVAVPISGKHNLREGGILGYDVLRHFVLTADFLKGRIHLGLPEEP